MSADQFVNIAAAVAQRLYGEPNKALSSKAELRFGPNGGLSLDIQKGIFYDFANECGGGVLWAVENATGQKGRDAVEWLRSNGFHIEDNRPQQSAPRPQNGQQREWLPPGVPDHAKLAHVYDYIDMSGNVIYQSCRYEWEDANAPKGRDKTFRQRRPDPEKPGRYKWGIKDVPQLPYRLDDVIEAVASDSILFIVEGEKQVDNLRKLGIPATTNSAGAGKFPDEIVKYFQGARVVILPDNDPQSTYKDDGRPKFNEDGSPHIVGLNHAKMVAEKLQGVAADIKMLALPNLPLKGDVSDWLAAGGTANELYKLVQTDARRWEKEPFKSKFRAVEWRDMEKPGPQHEWLIKGILTRREVSMLGGPSQAGKSFLVLDMAMAVARGIPWFGHKTLRGGVVYQAGEGALGFRKRLRAYKLHNNISVEDNVPFVLLPCKIDLYANDDQVNAMIAELKYWASTFDVPLELVVIDTFVKASPGANENDGKDVGVVLRRCERISEATGANVLLVHHMNADGGKLRGHSSIPAALENILIVKKVEGSHDGDKRQIREVTVDKQKEGESGLKHKFVLPAVVIGKDEDGDDVRSCVVADPNVDAATPRMPKDTNPVRVTAHEAVLYRAIEAALIERGIDAPRNLQLQKDLKVVEFKYVREQYEKLTLVGDDDDGGKAITAAMRKHGEKLLAMQAIGRDNPYMWITGKQVSIYTRSDWKPQGGQ